MDYLVTDFGAIGDGLTLDTQAIQAAIRQANTEGGGRVVFPTSKRFLSGSLILLENVELYLEQGSVLQASGNYEDYPPRLISDHTGGRVDEYVLPQRAFLAGFQADNLKITGPGEINGNSDGFIETRGVEIHQMRAPIGGRSQYLERPFTIFLIECQQVELLDFTLRDPAFWALRTTGCNDLLIDNVKILTDPKVPNADGIDIDRCERVVIQNCELITADDCISIKSCSGTAHYGDTRDIEIRNCFMTSASGAITLGTESVGLISEVLVTDCVVSKSNRGFAVRAREGGLISNVTFRNSRVDTVAFSPQWWGHGEALHVTAFAWNQPENLQDGNPERLLMGIVSNIVFDNLEVDTEAGVLIWGQQEKLIDNITVKNSKIRISKKSKWPSRIDLRPNDQLALVERIPSAFELVNCRNISLQNVSLTWGQETRQDYGTLINQANVTNLDIKNLTEVSGK